MDDKEYAQKQIDDYKSHLHYLKVLRTNSCPMQPEIREAILKGIQAMQEWIDFWMVRVG